MVCAVACLSLAIFFCPPPPDSVSLAHSCVCYVDHIPCMAGGGCVLTLLRPGATDAKALRLELEGQGFACYPTTIGAVGLCFHPASDPRLPPCWEGDVVGAVGPV